MNEIEVEFDCRGRLYVGGVLIGYEDEVETFVRLAQKYLLRDIREVKLLSDPPVRRFDFKSVT